MEEEMMEDNIVNEEYIFTAYEVDLDYEFDAARFFDFSRAESPLQARQAEVWFHSAGSYPPSRTLLLPSFLPLFSLSFLFYFWLVPREEILMNISPKSKGLENMDVSKTDSYIEVDHEISAMGMNCGGTQECCQWKTMTSLSAVLGHEFKAVLVGRAVNTVMNIPVCGKDVERKDKGTSSTLPISSQQKFQNPSQKLLSGLTFYNHMVNNINQEKQTKLSIKPSFPRTSTFMKPTVSQLAKQNRPFQTGYSRSRATVLEKTDKSSATTCAIDNQAAKRQKLGGGLLWKVAGTVQLQQTNFVHKAPKRDGFLDRNSTHTKPRITIPREPDLETTHRAQRTRPKSSKEADDVTSTVRRFKALPLNRKILEAPSSLPKKSTPHLPDFQEFHLKTSERAMQHSSAVSKSAVPCNHPDKDLHKYTTNSTTECRNREAASFIVFSTFEGGIDPSTLMNVSRIDGCQSSHSFKALPLNKKILTSKGDIGTFWNSKKETTVPMEFKFQTEKRSHNNPPVELFNKIKQPTILKLPVLGGNQQFGADVGNIEAYSLYRAAAGVEELGKVQKGKCRMILMKGIHQASSFLHKIEAAKIPAGLSRST
ncbi:hypothetical protein BUALT_Bualt10G0034400 [Buddleja alternifolia]|uniref:TPX2 central domain-containing protein n=1 Tax=Buddleja alternifolia TaxID=168488 RepID=A0AAV6WWK6_9LAMI|nr:hypothetical protein BUALT_Bualt10G0034400 [Buddleja alternifolia]